MLYDVYDLDIVSKRVGMHQGKRSTTGCPSGKVLKGMSILSLRLLLHVCHLTIGVS